MKRASGLTQKSAVGRVLNQRMFKQIHKVPTARLHIDSRTWQWPLKVIDEENAEASMAPVRVARERLSRTAAEELNCEIGTDAAVAAAVARTAARAQLAS